MEITKEQVDDLSFVLTLTLQPEDYTPAFNKGIKDARKKMQLKGFRKGMVPVSLVKKYVGNNLLGEKLGELINKNLTEYLKENEVNTLGEPLLKGEGLQIDYKIDKDYTIQFEVAPIPEVSFPILDNPSDFDFTHHKVILSEEEVKEELEATRSRFGDYQEVDEVESEKDDINVTLVELDENGEVKEEGIEANFDLPISFFKENIHQTIIGLGKGDLFESNIFEDIDKSEEDILKIILKTEQTREEIGDKFRISVDKISRMMPADLDQEFYNKVFQDEEILTADEFMTKFKSSIEEMYIPVTEDNLKGDFTEALIKTSPVTMPQEFLDRSYSSRSEEYKNLPKKSKKSTLKAIVKESKIGVILERAKQKKELEIEDYEIVDRAIGMTSDDMSRMYGGARLPYQLIEKYALERLDNDRDFGEQVHRSVIIGKLFEAVRDDLNITEKEVSLTELKEFVAEVNEKRRKENEEEE